MRRRFAAAGVIVFLAFVVVAVWYGARPPRPAMALPSGYRVVAVHGHCKEGSELFMCEAGDGPRSTLTVAADDSRTASFDSITSPLLSDGWTRELQRLCKPGQGCLVLNRAQGGRVLLDWFSYYNASCPGGVCPAPK